MGVGRRCGRQDCRFVHTDGRDLDGEPSKVVCKFGLNCSRPECFFRHPQGRRLGYAEHFEIYLDELEMPKRPPVSPGKHAEREMFMDPLPGDLDSPELTEFIASWG